MNKTKQTKKKEKWHILVVVLLICLDVPASHIRSKACYLNQHHSVGNYHVCTSPWDWLIAQVWLTAFASEEQGEQSLESIYECATDFTACFVKKVKLLWNSRRISLRSLWTLWRSVCLEAYFCKICGRGRHWPWSTMRWWGAEEESKVQYGQPYAKLLLWRLRSS